MEKMVRDRIHEYVMKIRGETLDTRIASPDELLDFYKQKVLEEANEVATATSEEHLIEEIADIMEVLEGMINVLGLKNRVEKAQIDKAVQRGGFRTGLILKMK